MDHKPKEDALDIKIRCLESQIHKLQCKEQALLASQNQYEVLIETIPYGIQEISIDGIITLSNKAHHRICGYPDGELIGKAVWDLVFDPAEKESLPKLLRNLAEEQPEPEPYISKNMTKDGNIVDIQVDWDYKRDTSGKVIGFISIITDISDQLKASQDLEQSEQRYRALFENAGDAIFLIDAEGPDAGRIQDTNRAAAKMHGYTVSEIKRLRIQDLDSPEDAANAPALIKRILAGEWIKKEIVHRKKDGTRFPVEISVGLIKIGNKKVVLGIDRDITDRRLAEQQLKDSETRYRAIFEGSSEGILLADIDTFQFKFANPAICDFLGYSNHELVNMSVQDIHPAKDLGHVKKEFAAQASGEKILATQIPCRRKDGSIVYADIRSGQINVEGTRYLVGFFADITARKQAEARNSLLAAALDQSPEMIIITNLDGVIQYVNSAFERLSGYSISEAVGRTPALLKSGVHTAEFYRDLWQQLKHGVSWRGRLTNRRKDGGLFEVEATLVPVVQEDGRTTDYLAVERDITQELLQDKQMRQAQKMEAIGTLAGGIAHDFNNILSAIIGYTDIAHHELPEESPLKRYMEKVLQAGDRARSLVKQILAFSSSSEKEPRPVVMNIIVEEVLKLLQATLPSTLTIRTDLKYRATILADPTQIHQVIMNLCTNAAQAIGAENGTLAIAISDITLKQNNYNRYAQLPSGAYVNLRISDTGPGIPAQLIERIFDPFFTTKKPGQGTGMGLAVVHGIVKECGGAVSVSSQEGQGSTFEVLLPVIEDMQDHGPATKEALPLGNERILFVDDEPEIVDVGLRMLRLLGYQVTAVSDSEEALAIFRQSPQDFDLVITDMTMPRMTGDQLAKHLSAIRPDIPIIICTGYSEKLDESNYHTMGFAAIAFKPLVIKTVAKLIRQTFDQCQ